MRSCTRTALLVILTFIVLAAARTVHGQAIAPATGRLPKVGIICLDAPSAKGEATEAVLTAEFSTSKSFRLVERQALQKVLQEQNLQEFSDTAGMTKVGQLVGADLLLLLEPVRNSSPAAMRVRVAETATGIILLDSAEALATLVEKPQGLRQTLEGAVRRTALPLTNRKLVGIVGVWSEDPSSLLDPLRASLDPLLRTDLAQSPTVVVLEREQLQHLTAEATLGGVEQKLRAATILVDLSLKRSAGPASVDVAVKLTHFDGTKAQTLNLTMSLKDIALLRKQLSNAILLALQAPLPPGAAGDIKAEAKAFADRAKLLLSYGHSKEACPMAEAAFALDPQRPYGVLAERCNNSYAHESGLPLIEKLKASRRAVEISCDAAKRYAAADDFLRLRDEMPQMNFAGFFAGQVFAMFPLPATPTAPEEKVLRDIVGMFGEEHEVIMAAYRRNKLPLARETRDFLTLNVEHFLVKDTAEYARFIHSAVDQYRIEVRAGTFGRQESPEILRAMNLVCGGTARSGVGNVNQDDLKPLLIWMTQQPEGWLRVAGWDGLSCFPGPEGDQAAVKTLDLLYWGDIGEDDRHIVLDESAGTMRLNAHWRLRRNGTRVEYVTALLDKVQKNDDGLPLVRWTELSVNLASDWSNPDSLISVDTSPASIGRVKRIRALLLLKAVPDTFRADLQAAQHDLNGWLAESQKRLDDEAGTAKNDWDGFQGQEIKLGQPPAGTERVVWAHVDHSGKDPELLFLWQGPALNQTKDRADFKLVVTRMPLMGGPLTKFAEGILSGPVGKYFDGGSGLSGFRISDGINTPAGMFFGDYGQGIIVARDGKLVEWTEKDGLPSKRVWSLGYADGKLYVGMDGGFAELDPHTGRANILASSKALKPANPLDGGTLYRVGRILAVPDGKTLWLTIGAIGETTNRYGVWRYDLVTGKFERKVTPVDYDTKAGLDGPMLAWHEDKLLIIGVDSGLYDPQTGKRLTSLRGFLAPGDALLAGSFLDPDPIPGTGFRVDFGADQDKVPGIKTLAGYTDQHRCVLIGNRLVASYGELVLPGPTTYWAKRSSFYPQDGGIWDFVERAGPGFIAVSYGWHDRPTKMWCITPREGK